MLMSGVQYWLGYSKFLSDVGLIYTFMAITVFVSTRKGEK